MTNPCYDFALRQHPHTHSNIPNSYIERRHKPKRAPSPASPSSQDSLDDVDHTHKNQQRGDRGRWKTDGTVSIAEGYDDSKPQSSSCQCTNCTCNRETAYQDFDPSPRRRPKSSREFSGGNDGGGGFDQPGNRKHPPPVPKVDHSLWNPLQLLRRPHTSSQRGRDRESSRPNTSSCAYSFPRPNSRSRDGCSRKEAYTPNRSPPTSSKVRTLRRVPQQRRLSPRKSPNRCGSSKIPSPISSSRRRYHHIEQSRPPWRQTLDIACQTRREEFPLTPEETPRSSPVRRVIASDSFYHDRPLSARPFSCPAVQRRPSPCRCPATSAAAAAAAQRGCCCNHCVGWPERTPCAKSVVALPPLHPGNHHGCADCHQGCHHGVCPRAAEPVRTGECCSKCHQPLPLNK